jgi:Zn ribbon nucleic-acid-binding protein
MTNTNCLAGLACPECGNDSRLHIETRAMADVTDDGAETFGDMEWNDESSARCPACGHGATLQKFRVESKEETPTQPEKE